MVSEESSWLARLSRSCALFEIRPWLSCHTSSPSYWVHMCGRGLWYLPAGNGIALPLSRPQRSRQVVLKGWHRPLFVAPKMTPPRTPKKGHHLAMQKKAAFHGGGSPPSASPHFTGGFTGRHLYRRKAFREGFRSRRNLIYQVS